MDQMNLKTIYVEVLPPYVQAGLRLHVTPGMSFDQVQRMAHNFGKPCARRRPKSRQSR
jgi:hypothetical protein